MEIKLDNMLEVCELVAALKGRQKELETVCTWEGEDGLAKTALRNIVRQVREAYPYVFEEEEE